MEIVSQLAGDLDWVVMKCLEKERSRRYETANGIAADIQHHFDNEPVMARPPGNFYLLQKFAWQLAEMRSRLGGAKLVEAMADRTLQPDARLRDLAKIESLLLESEA